jgi:archaellum component FlaD/FlaE
MMRRDTDIEGDLSAAAAETNTSELGPTAEEDETASEGEDSVSDDDGETEPSREAPVEADDEELVDDGAEADTEDGGSADTNTVEHVPADDVDETNTSSVVCQMRRGRTGELALGVEAPVWMWGAGVAVVTAYLWIVVFLIKGGSR